MGENLTRAMRSSKQRPGILRHKLYLVGIPKTGVHFLNPLTRLKKQAKAILMSTHDIFRSKEIADRVGIMKEGKMVMQKTREELAHEDLEKLYLDYVEARAVAV